MPKAVKLPAPISVMGHSHLRRRAAGEPGDTHQPAHPLGHQVEPAPIAVRPAPAKTRDAGVDESRVDLRQLIVTQPQPVHHPRTEVLRHNVRRLHHATKHTLALIRAQIQRNAPLVSVQRQKAGGEPVLIPTPHAPRVVPAARPLDLDNVGAHIGQQHRAHRPRHNLRQIQHLHPHQRPGRKLLLIHN